MKLPSKCQQIITNEIDISKSQQIITHGPDIKMSAKYKK